MTSAPVFPSLEVGTGLPTRQRRLPHATHTPPNWSAWLAFVLVLALAWGCGEPPKGVKLPASSETSAELIVVRRGVTVEHRGESARAPYAVERIGEGALVKLEEGALAWVRRDGGAKVLLKGPASMTLDGGILSVSEGRMFVEVPEGITETVRVASMDCALSSVKASVEASAANTAIFVLAGEIRLGSAVAKAGETLRAKSVDAAKVEPTVTWEDWTGGLATTDAASAPPPFGVGTVGARSPGASGAPRLPLTIQRLDVRVRIVGDLAVTEVDQVFFNPQSQTVEGVYFFRTPENAVLQRFGVDRDGGILYGYVKEKQAAQAQYESKVFAGSKEDPALLTYRATGEYEARLYPIGPGATRRVVTQYTEWLPRSGEAGERRLYTYPMAFEGAASAAPHVEDMSIEVDLSKAGAKSIRSGAGAVRAEDVIIVRKHDIIPRADFSLELFDGGIEKVHAIRAGHRPDSVVLGAAEAADARRSGDGEADYLLVPIRSKDWAPVEAGLDVVIVVDTSAATDAAMLRSARATTRAILTHLGAKDRAVVLAGDDRLRTISGTGELVQVNDESRRAMIEGLARVNVGGATDLAAMLTQAAAKLGDTRRSAIVYIGDGAATVGEVDLAALRERLKKAPRAVRTFGLGIGDGANVATLAGLSTGGFAARITDEETAARVALRVLARAERSVALGATVDLGANVERIYPRELGAVTEGESSFVVGRITGDSPKEISLTTARGTTTLPVVVQTIEDEGDLRRRWAIGRLGELIESAAGHAALVDLGVRQGIITPVTSIYVPTSSEMTADQRRSIDRKSRVRRQLKTGEDDAESADDEQTVEKKQKSDKDKEGGTGTRAKGEEGSMGNKDSAKPTPSAMATASPQASAATEREMPDQELLEKGRLEQQLEEQQLDGAAKTKRRYGVEADPRGDRAGGDDKPASAPTTVAPAPPPPPTDPTPDAKPLPAKPSSAPQGAGYGNGSSRLADLIPAEQEKANFESKSGNRHASLEEADEFGMIGILDANSDQPWGGAKTAVIRIDDPGRVVRLCGPGAKLPFEERKSLWRERLTGASANPRSILAIYKQAQALCEAPTERERRALLLMALDFMPSVQARVTFYRMFGKDATSAGIVYRGILSRITTTEHVRELNRALGVQTVDPTTLEKALVEAKSPKERVETLRAFVARFPDDTALLMTLLDSLEDAEEFGAARVHARELRKRSDADARLRTAVGEFHLRLAKKGSKDEAAEDEAEARRAFGEIVEFAPDDPVARRRLGDLYRAHGYYAEATRQYETLARLVPDEPTVAVLIALSQNGLGKLEEAVRWTEKGQKAGAPDVSQGPHATARAFAGLFLAWGRIDAKKANRTDEWKTLLTRTGKLLGSEKTEGRVRVVMSWAHPELHPTMFTNALGSMMPASEGDVSLGLTQAVLADKGAGSVEVRLEPADLAKAARLGATLRVTAIFGEGTEAEAISTVDVTFDKSTPSTQRWRVANGSLEVAQ